MANMNALQQMIFPDENAPIHRKKSVTAASVKTKGPVLGQKKPGAARKALNDITNKSGIHPKASSKNKQIASSASAKSEINIAGERFLHDHSKCIKEQQNLWDDHADLLLLHHDSSIKEKHLKFDIEMMDAKNNLTYDEAEEIPSPKLTGWLNSSTPWRSPIRRHGSTMMPSTPLPWRFDSAEFTLKEDYDDDLF
ncbi:hypothetical protein EUTSA_v10021564mg [Eutrema salsugineum]|uniref:Uncharacterized protein n=1 Tax=Eutrema salsugineum TaxID=72664 RepID=V4M887_EUTSA|nr:protein PATRONUS 1 [Eutrema salsugineum]ESQ48568.1 hypothetical protein EUTSA_v10021564mg [Eutrema salsugineum]